MKEMNIKDIRIIMSDIKKQKKKIISNYFGELDNIKEDLKVDLSSETIIILYEDIGVKRVYFYSCNVVELTEMLKKLPKDSVIDYITKNEDENKDIFINSGFKVFEVFGRMSTKKMTEEEIINLEKDLDKYKKIGLYNENYAKIATRKEANLIYNKIKEIFDMKVSHLCSFEEFCELVDNGWVLYHRIDDEIVSFYVYKIEGKKKYGYQLYNNVGIDILYSLVLKARSDVKRLGITYDYAWVSKTNLKAIRFNNFFNIEFDGLVDIIYVKE